VNRDTDAEDLLRAALADYVRHAPDGARLAERILTEADRPGPVRDRRRTARWRGWTLPVVAAASMAAVVALIVGVVQWNRPHTRTASYPAASSLQSSPLAPSSGASPGSTVGAPFVGFRSTDLTFVSLDEGWTLGSAQCPTAPSLRCYAIMHTRDGGARWTAVSNPPAGVAVDGSCASARCIDHIRFADASTGYAFGPNVLFMTTDGGQHWTEQKGGATSLEVANGTAIRILGDALQIAPAGQDAWRSVTLPGADAVGGKVVRALSRVYVPAAAGGFYASRDDGKTWTEQPDPCGGTSIQTMTAAADGSLVVLCSAGTGGGPRLLISDDCGSTFAPWPGRLNAGQETIAAADRSTVFVVRGGRLERGVDHGRSWTAVAEDTTPGNAAFLGFENPQTGRWITGDGSVIWTTRDAGRTWTARTFG
jgi:photosystem II stability/assembly factor-like uncharacterized protein